MSSTDGYLYSDVVGLAVDCANKNPEWVFYLPLLSKWADKELSWQIPAKVPENLVIYIDPDFCEQLDLMMGCSFGIFADNGVHHVYGRTGGDFLLLDPQFNKPLWTSRWRFAPHKSVPINITKDLLVDLIHHLLATPETRLLPVMQVANMICNGMTDWANELLFKYNVPR
jgi:hypothetical protein